MHYSMTGQGSMKKPRIKNPEFFRLVESEGIIDRAFINDLLEEFEDNALDVLATMIQSGIAPKRKLCQLWCDSIGIAHVDLEKTLFQNEVVQKVPERIARMYYAIPVYQMGDTITVATPTPDNRDVEKILKEVTGGPVSLVFALPQDIETSIEKEYTGSSAVYEFFSKLSSSRLLVSQKALTTRSMEAYGGDAALNQLHIAIILYGVTKSASEIRLTPGPEKARIDLLIPYGDKIEIPVEKNIYEALADRLKVLAGVDPSATGIRYGRIQIPTPGKKFDLKFESRPDEHGPAIILKLSTARPLRSISSLNRLYLSKRVLSGIAGRLNAPKGHILIAAPPKSGKSTLAYALLKERANQHKKNVTIEQAAKYLIPGIDQLQVNPDAGVLAVDLLASVLQQKTDTLYIQHVDTPGILENIAAAADSGPFFLSGLTADNTLDALEKLIRLEQPPSLSAIIAQQRVSRLCDICKVKYPLKPDHVQSIFVTDGYAGEVSAWRGNGCPYCNDSGFSGLIGIHELLLIDAPIQKMITGKMPIHEIRKAVNPENFYSMHYDGIKKVLRGLTTFDEIHRLPVG